MSNTTITATTTTTTTTTTTAATTVQNAIKKYDNFLDNPFNMAMYVVLPAMVFVYGGCCVIYCVAKLHRFCRRRARRRAKRRLIQKDEDLSDEDSGLGTSAGRQTSLSVVAFTSAVADPLQPAKPAKPVQRAKPVEPVQRAKPVEPAKPVKPAVYPKPSMPPARTRGSFRASSSMASARGVQPGYLKTQDLQQHMKHLDDQLKAAFHMISDEPKGVKSRPDLCARSNENKRSITKRPGKAWIQFYVSDQ